MGSDDLARDDVIAELQERVANPEVAGSGGRGGMCYVDRDVLVAAIRHLTVDQEATGGE